MRDYTFGDATGVAGNGRDFDGAIIHVEGEGSVSFAPKAMKAATKSIVAGEKNQGIVSQPQRLKSVQKAADLQIHGRDGGEVTLEVSPDIVIDTVRQRMILGPRVNRFLGTRLKGTVPIQIHNLLRVVIKPWAVGSRIVHTQIERTVVSARSIQKRQRIIGDEISQVFGFAHQSSVSDHRGVVVRTAPFQVHVPMGKAFLPFETVAQVPLAA